MDDSKANNTGGVLLPNISIITPVFNGALYIGQTMDSIYNQAAVLNGSVRIEHIIVDGLSTDDTPKVIESHQKAFTTVIRERDKGMYDALSKGLRIALGEIVCYLNAGDYYLPSAFDTVSSVFSDIQTSWITGTSTHFGPQQMITMTDPPFRYKRNLIKSGAYGKFLPFIQQENTFWKRDLHISLDFEKLASFKLAGDFFMWWSFASIAELDVVHSVMGGFSKQSGQLSDDMSRYFSEVSQITGKPSAFSRLEIIREKLGWATSPYYRRKLNRKSIQFDYSCLKWSRQSKQPW
jgi:glycosyltransferase involved in cell wall biosynthesis